jgi:16S rRNA (uracil1498-N3)-methyltransferase
LFVDAPLSAAARVICTAEQANYLLSVLRLAVGAEILLFNGRDGEWRARLEPAGKRGAVLVAIERVRAQTSGPDVYYLFAPLKRSRLDYMVQKATEMGVARLMPVLTRRTIAERVNLDRMRANVIEAAEQCGVLRVPEVGEPQRLERVLALWDEARALIFCDEAAGLANPISALNALAGQGAAAARSLAVLIGPEGGFAPEEREELLARPFVTPISLGPRIMRADTAAVAALALVNATLGDWG